jgi:hypothetical protein
MHSILILAHSFTSAYFDKHVSCGKIVFDIEYVLYRSPFSELCGDYNQKRIKVFV